MGSHRPSRTPRSHSGLESTLTPPAARRLRRALQRAPTPPESQPTSTHRQRRRLRDRTRPADPTHRHLRRAHQRVPTSCLTLRTNRRRKGTADSTLPRLASSHPNPDQTAQSEAPISSRHPQAIHHLRPQPKNGETPSISGSGGVEFRTCRRTDVNPHAVLSGLPLVRCDPHGDGALDGHAGDRVVAVVVGDQPVGRRAVAEHVVLVGCSPTP